MGEAGWNRGRRLPSLRDGRRLSSWREASELTLQELMLALARFWAEAGCFIGQPYDVEKGAGTMNPLTFFRSLGPEPWRVAYVEPSRRPADARFGENPNRLYRHHQYQVLLKPCPADVQELYLGSLAAIGLDARAHDVRFVEDNWEAPTLGAWGIGWEVWVDGMEITQFTYFQQMGGIELDVLPVEITYGLERITAYVQGVQSVFDVEVVPGLTYGDIVRREEYEHSAYSFLHADMEYLRERFRGAENEARRAAAEGLYFASYDHVLHCSHIFNLLEARGAVAPAQRTEYIARIREGARRVAELYLKDREAQGYPLMGRVARWS